MKNLLALALIMGTLAMEPIIVSAQTATTAPSTAATSSPATAPSPDPAPTPNPDTIAPDLADGLIDCRMAVNDTTKSVKDAISICLTASQNYSKHAQSVYDDTQTVTDVVCKLAANAAITADVADFVYEQNTKTHDASAGLLKLAKMDTELVAKNGCAQKYIDGVNKAFADTHPAPD